MNQVIISVNNQTITENFNPNATVSDVVQNLLGQNEYADQIISQITIDGKVLNVDEEDSVMPSKLIEFGRINFTLKSNIELAFEALESCNLYIDTIVEQISHLTQSYQEGRNDDANIQFAEVIEITDLFIQLISRVQKTLRGHLASKWVKPTNVTQLEIHLLSILKALVPAKEKNDIIMLCDLLEYELVDNLKQWKIKALPELRALRNLCESTTPHS